MPDPHKLAPLCRVEPTDCPALPKDAIKEMIADGVKQGVSEAMQKFSMTFGVDLDEAHSILELRADLIHLRAWRTSTETIKAKGIGAAVTFLVLAVLGSLGLALRAALNGVPIPPH